MASTAKQGKGSKNLKPSEVDVVTAMISLNADPKGAPGEGDSIGPPPLSPNSARRVGSNGSNRIPISGGVIKAKDRQSKDDKVAAIVVQQAMEQGGVNMPLPHSGRLHPGAWSRRSHGRMRMSSGPCSEAQTALYSFIAQHYTGATLMKEYTEQAEARLWLTLEQAADVVLQSVMKTPEGKDLVGQHTEELIRMAVDLLMESTTRNTNKPQLEECKQRDPDGSALYMCTVLLAKVFDTARRTVSNRNRSKKNASSPTSHVSPSPTTVVATVAPSSPPKPAPL